jgi:hypothetical protein
MISYFHGSSDFSGEAVRPSRKFDDLEGSFPFHQFVDLDADFGRAAEHRA